MNVTFVAPAGCPLFLHHGTKTDIAGGPSWAEKRFLKLGSPGTTRRPFGRHSDRIFFNPIDEEPTLQVRPFQVEVSVRQADLRAHSGDLNAIAHQRGVSAYPKQEAS